MILTIAYFAEPSTPDAQPAILTVANGGLATHSEALATARNTADQLQAHSFVIDFPDGTTERHVRDGERWRESVAAVSALGHQLPRRAMAGAAATPPTPDTKADGRRDGSGPTGDSERTLELAPSVGSPVARKVTCSGTRSEVGCGGTTGG
jgi:hypothetical protein